MRLLVFDLVDIEPVFHQEGQERSIADLCVRLKHFVIDRKSGQIGGESSSSQQMTIFQAEVELYVVEQLGHAGLVGQEHNELLPR